MEDLASMRYNIINPMISTFVEQEKKFFGTCFSLINNFYNSMYKLQAQVPYQKSTYDPMKYTRASKIMEGVDTNSLPAIKMKAKYSYDDYKNNLQRANSCATNNISTSTFNNFGNNNGQSLNKKFSFEDYKARKSSVDYANKNNLNNNNINTNMNININNNNNSSNNPYSYEAYRKRTQSLGNNKRPQINNNESNQNNYYHKNMNIVMNSILGDENTSAKNPFGNIRNNPYSSNNNNGSHNPYDVSNNNLNNNNSNNPYSNIFNSSHNNSNSNNNYGSIFGNNQQNNNNNDNNNRFRKPPDKYNFGF